MHVDQHDSALLLVRHGESEWNAARRLQGHGDPPLSERGRGQARALREPLAGLGAARAVASDLVRARETAALAGFDLLPTDPRWREIDVGEWTGRAMADVAPGELDGWSRGRHVPAGGESWADLVARVGGAVEELRAAGGAWLVFTHGGCVRAAIAHVTGASPTAMRSPDNASLTLIELGDRPRLLAFNRALTA